MVYLLVLVIFVVGCVAPALISGLLQGYKLTTLDGIEVTPWIEPIELPGNVTASAIATDNSGNIYVTGSTKEGLYGNTHVGKFDIFVIKYNSSGIRQWARQIGTPQEDYAYDIATDNSGNIYIAGTTGGNLDGNTSAGGVVVKYDSSGVRQWVKQIRTSRTVVSSSIATDRNGNIYVTGDAASGVFFIVKYDSSGIKQWSKELLVEYPIIIGARNVVVDSSGNIYAAGFKGCTELMTTTHFETIIETIICKRLLDLFVIKYDSSGIMQWSQQLGTFRADMATGITTDNRGNIYVAGQKVLIGGWRFFILKYNADGNMQEGKKEDTSLRGK